MKTSGNTITKVCTKCKIEKSIEFFSKNKCTKDGYNYWCRECLNKANRKLYHNDIERQRKRGKLYKKNNKNKVREYTKNYYNKNKVEINKKARIYQRKNRKRYNAIAKKWRDSNRDKISKYKKENKGKVNANTAKRYADKLKRTPSYADLDKIQEFYIEAQIKTKSTGIKHVVDHIIPLNGETVSGFHHENNLQVITEKENMSKSNKYPYENTNWE